MRVSDYFNSDAIDPIDIAEQVAAEMGLDYDFVADDQIAMAAEGQWRTYSISLAHSRFDNTLRMVCTYEAEHPTARNREFLETINLVNDQCWAGHFTYWEDQKLMVYRYGLILDKDNLVTDEQVKTMINTAVASAERFYPVFQMVCWADKPPQEAMKMADVGAPAYGRA